MFHSQCTAFTITTRNRCRNSPKEGGLCGVHIKYLETHGVLPVMPHLCGGGCRRILLTNDQTCRECSRRLLHEEERLLERRRLIEERLLERLRLEEERLLERLRLEEESLRERRRLEEERLRREAIKRVEERRLTRAANIIQRWWRYRPGGIEFRMAMQRFDEAASSSSASSSSAS